MRTLSYPESSEVDTYNEVPVFTAGPAPEVEGHPDEVWANEIFRDDPPRAKKSNPLPPSQKNSNKRKPKRPEYRLTLILLFLTVLGVAAGVTHYWKEVTVAGYFALAWLLLVSVLVLVGVVYRVLLYLLKIAGMSFKAGRRILLPAIFIFTSVYVWRVAPWLPVVDSKIDAAVSSKLSNIRPHFIYESSDGREVYSEGSRLVGEDELWNSYLKSAIINIEDERYQERFIPIDPKSVIRAAYKNAITKKREGASTLQIQIVDLLFDDFESLWLNKIFEWLIALRLDAKLPDRATQLAVYANLIPGNENTQGAAALAADLFNISDLRKLTPEQAALIAASLKGSNYNPRLNRAEALSRRNVALKKMYDHGDINAEQYGVAVRTELQIESQFKPYEYFVRAAQSENADFFAKLIKRRIDFRGGGPTIEDLNSKHNASPIIRVKLSLDPQLQQIAERRIADPIRSKTLRGSLPATTDVAFVAIENDTGRVTAVIRALKGELDITRRTLRDLGSTWKPLQAASALTRRAILAEETFADIGPMKFAGQVMHNYGNHYSGEYLSIVDCIAHSSNVCAMQVQERLDANEWRTGITELNLPRPRRFEKMGIGDAWPVPMFRLASAYTALPNGGEMVMPSYVVAATVENAVVEVPVMRRRVFDADACRVVLDGMQACLTRGTGTAAASLSSVARGKTGTTQDSLAVLQTRKITMAVWVGDRTSNRDLKKTGGALAMRLLVEFLREVRKTRPELAPQF